jgi:hypothetical protein
LAAPDSNIGMNKSTHIGRVLNILNFNLSYVRIIPREVM